MPEQSAVEKVEQSVVHNTFVIERSYPVSPERVFAAFADPVKKRRWYGESRGHDVEQFDMDFRVGGAESLRYRLKEGTPFPGMEITNDGEYHDIVNNRRVVLASRMSLSGRCFSVSLVTLELLSNGDGTDLICTHQGAFFEGADGPEMRQAGWRQLLEKLAIELSS